MTPGHPVQDACPHWCVADHSPFQEPEAQFHMGVQEEPTARFTVRLVASRDPGTGTLDGPYLLVDAPPLASDSPEYELTLDEARTIGRTLMDLAEGGAQMSSRPARVTADEARA